MKSRSLNNVIREKHGARSGCITVLTGARQTGKILSNDPRIYQFERNITALPAALFLS